MVTFNVASSNDGSNHDGSSSSSSSSHPAHHEEKFYRKTPHPSAKHSTHSTAEHGAIFASNMDACISNVPSPEVARASGGTNSGQEVDDEANEDEDLDGKIMAQELQDAASTSEPLDKWELWVDETCNKGTSPANLEAYMTAKEAREDVKRAFETALDECLQGITQAMTEDLLRETVGFVYQEQSERFQLQESNIIATIQSNHDRRSRMIEQVEQANANWGRDYKKMRYAVLRCSEDENEETEREDELVADSGDDLMRNTGLCGAGDFAKSSGTADDHHGGVTVVTGRESNESGSDEPNWDKIAEFQAARNNVHFFLAAREKFRDTDDALFHAMDVIHSGLQANADAILQVVIDFYNKYEEYSVALEHDIQYLLMTNCQRREALQERVEESAKQAQGLFADLLSRLGQRRG